MQVGVAPSLIGCGAEFASLARYLAAIPGRGATACLITGRMSGRAMRYFLIFPALVFGLLLIGSYLGVLHPLGDSLAVFRWHFAFGLMVLSLTGVFFWRGKRIWWLMLVLPGAWIAAGIWFSGQKIGIASDYDYQVYQKNLSFRGTGEMALVNDIIVTGADFVTLQEVDQQNRLLLAELEDTHPAQAYCDFWRVGDVAVASGFPRTQADILCVERSGMVAMQVQTDHGPLWVVSLHLYWPFPYDQAAQVERLLPHLEAFEGPVLVAGDFNMVPWSHTVRSIEGATDTQRAGHLLYTFSMKRGLLSLPIDHVLVPGTFATEIFRRPLLGSDHYGVLARFTMPR